MVVMVFKVLPAFVLLFAAVDASRILAAIPTASFSHQVFYRPLWKELTKRGHEVTLVTTDPMKDPTLKNLTEIDVSVAYDYKQNENMQEIFESDKTMAIHKMIEILYKNTRLYFGHKDVKNLFLDKSITFDLVMIECVFPSSFAFAHRFDAPVICLTSLDAHYIIHAAMGNPTHHILYPNFLLPVGNPMSFTDRLLTVIAMNVLTAYMDYWVYPEVRKILDEEIQDEKSVMPESSQMFDKIDMVFTNTNPLFNAVRPYSPATISLAGGLHETSTKPLPKDLQDFLDGATEGVIYFSLGSNVKSKDISPKLRQQIIAAFEELPHKILWKFEADTLPNQPKNVKIVKWLPQQDVLRHRNVKLFITQAGMQSLEEALFARVPMVAIPFFGDQDVNAQRMAQKGLGLTLNYKTMSKSDFKLAILEVMHNKKYKNRVVEVASMIQDLPMKPLEQAVWWTEYVLRHKGAGHLKGPQIPLWQYYYLDVFTVIGGVLGVVFLIFIKVTCYGKRLICRMVNKYRKAPIKTKKSKSKKE